MRLLLSESFHTFYISTASGAIELSSEMYEVILSCYLPFRHVVSDNTLNNDLLSRNGDYLRAGRSGFRVPAGVGGILFSRISQTGSGAHPASCSIGTRVRSVELTTYLYLVPICLHGLNRHRLTACKDYDVEGCDQGVSVNGPVYRVLHKCLFEGFNTLRTGSFKLFKLPFPGFLTILTL